VNKINYRRIQDAVDLAVAVEAEELALLPVMPSGRALETKIYVSAEEYLEALSKAASRAREYSLKLSALCTPWAPLLRGDIRYWLCRDMVGMDIDPSGDVLLCDIINLKITNVRDKSISDAFVEFRENEIVRKIINPVSLPRECKLCELSSSCRGGCYARSYIIRGDFNAGDPICPLLNRILR
jgi:Predicted Fe-S oxidoreductases